MKNSIHKFYILFNPKTLKKLRTTLFLKEYGRFKIRNFLNPFFYTGKHQTVKDIKKNRKGIFKRLVIYVD